MLLQKRNVQLLTFLFQRGRQGRAEILHGSKLLLRLVATRNAKGHGKDDARQGKEGILITQAFVPNCAYVLTFSQPHRPRGTEGGRQHKKRVRQPHNTRERQKQVAMGQGEYLMPEVNPYRSSKVILELIC